MVSQQASNRCLKTVIEDELRTKARNVFHSSIIRTEKMTFYDLDEMNDGVTSGRDHKDETRITVQ